MVYAFFALVCATVGLVIWKLHALESARESAEAKAHELALELREVKIELASCKARCNELQRNIR